MILVDQTRGLAEESEEYDTNDDFDFEDAEGENEGILPSLGFNNYLNNLHINFNLNLNDRLSAFETSLRKFYENTQFPHFPPVKSSSIVAITNLWKQLKDEESEAELKRLQFQEVQKKAAEELRKRLEPKIKSDGQQPKKKQLNEVHYDSDSNTTSAFVVENKNNRSDSTNEEEGENISLLDQEFWTKFLGFKSDGFMDASTDPVPAVMRDSQPKTPLNPFYSRLNLTFYDKIKAILLTVVVLPIRLILITVFLLLAIVFVFIGSIFLSEKSLFGAPLAKWRRWIKWITAYGVMRALFFFAGFHWITYKGKQASRSEAPIYVVAPHSSYLDAFLVIFLGAPSVVAKESSRKIPCFGKLIDFTQAIYVNRQDAASRHSTAAAIEDRAKSEEDWPQVFIFPEGTCTNRSALIQFKPGAFRPGVPVQPVVVRYPNRLDTLTWTFDSPSWMKTLWLTLTQFNNHMEIEFLPVYNPSAEEMRNDKLYTLNVQRVMAKALGIPSVDFSFEDGRVFEELGKGQIRNKLETIWRIKGALNLRESPVETTLAYEGTIAKDYDWNYNLNRFQSIYQNSSQNADSQSPEVAGLFNLFRKENETTIDLRAYLLLNLFMYSNAELNLMVALMFKMYTNQRSIMDEQSFQTFMQNVFDAEKPEAYALFNAGITDETGISASDFQKKIIRRVEFVKLYAMEVTGQQAGYYPPIGERDLSVAKIKSKTE